MLSDCPEVIDPVTGLLILDPKHPGIHDVTYQKRRTDFFRLAQTHRLNALALAHIDYTDTEHNIWRHINERLHQLHLDKACHIYLRGKQELGLSNETLPQLHMLNKQLMQTHEMGLVPAEGLIEPRAFFSYLTKRQMPCTIFLRHESDPEYTPEPDIVHDVLGHLPPLMNKEYADLMQLIGLGVAGASDAELTAWARVYWFAIEFGLIVENDELKVFGAGLLSSVGEMAFCYSDQVTHKPFVMDEVMQTDYDPTLMQKTLFYIPSFEFLKNEIKKRLK